MREPVSQMREEARNCRRSAMELAQEEVEKSAAIRNGDTDQWSEGDQMESESLHDRNRRKNSA